MDHTDIKWCSLAPQFMAENSEIPCDITFKFNEVPSDDAGVAAHKMLLAMVSKIFRNMFYGYNTADRLANEIVIEDTTKPVFQVMIDAFYNAKPMKESLKGKCIHEVFAVLYLVNKYEIRDLMLVVEECLSSFPITEDKVLEVSTDAMEYVATFEASAQNVLFACAKFLKPKLATIKSIFRFVAKNCAQFSVMQKLMALLDDMTPACFNCNSEPCLNGMLVRTSQFIEGLKVAHNPTDNLWNPRLKYWTGNIVNIMEDNKVKVKSKFAVGQSKEYSKVEEICMEDRNGKSRFIFNCK